MYYVSFAAFYDIQNSTLLIEAFFDFVQNPDTHALVGLQESTVKFRLYSFQSTFKPVFFHLIPLRAPSSLLFQLFPIPGIQERAIYVIRFYSDHVFDIK